jgi:hypothetical protein
MSGFFGIIDRHGWQGFRLVPQSSEANSLILGCRSMMQVMPAMSGNSIALDDHFDQRGVALDDVGILALLAGLVLDPPNPEFRMVAATAVAIVLNSPFFYIQGSVTADGCDCEVFIIYADDAADAQRQFMSLL